MTDDTARLSRSRAWKQSATEWAEETIENGPSTVIGGETATAVAQTLMALLAERGTSSEQGVNRDAVLEEEAKHFDQLGDDQMVIRGTCRFAATTLRARKNAAGQGADNSAGAQGQTLPSPAPAAPSALNPAAAWPFPKKEPK